MNLAKNPTGGGGVTQNQNWRLYFVYGEPKIKSLVRCDQLAIRNFNPVFAPLIIEIAYLLTDTNSCINILG